MKKFFLIGQHINTSLSPLIHNGLFKMKNFKGQYSLYKQNYLPSFQQIKSQNISGLSITIPFKKSFAKYDELFQFNKQKLSSKLIQRRVINTLYASNQISIIFQNNAKQKILTYRVANTDIFGVKKCLQKSLEEYKSQEIAAIVIGGGVLLNKNVKVIVINRNVQKIENLCKEYQNIANIFPITKQNIKYKQRLGQIDEKVKNILIINTLPSSVFNQNKLKIPFESLLSQFMPKSNISLMDVNYRDNINALKDYISNINNKHFGNLFKVKTVSNGLDMLRWQAIQQNRLFCNQAQFDNKKYNNHYKFVRNLTLNLQDQNQL